MAKFQKIIGYACYAAGVIVGYYKVGLIGALLVFIGWIAACVFCNWGLPQDDDADTEPEHDSCDGCKNDLGGGHCRINVEDECREGGGFELWEGRDDA